MPSKKISNEGQHPSQQANKPPPQPANEPKAKQPKTEESKTDSPAPKQDAAKPKEHKAPAGRRQTESCPRCCSTGFLGACHTCGWGTGIGMD
ncbi:hypothetical protein MFRU_005g03880 [Monilinia fructicola]|uniref:Uncharacterized protein n=1 Tax=Monilinia fructicola TaxID=38448 RepID=A0A5M9JTX5_MONFR|nr:hypothetical protein EYC84_002608 [Monilinia fructicola]KAG4033380.1 hypothetical protein MFRU_005g03880 [Monilinia fructicola]